MHRRGAGVVRLPSNVSSSAALSDDGLHHAERKSSGSPAPDPARCETPGIRPRWSERAPPRHALDRAQSRESHRSRKGRGHRAAPAVLVQLAHQRAASDEGNSEAHTFFFGKSDDFDVTSRRPPSSDQSEIPSTTPKGPSNPGVRHRIQVRSDDQARRSARGRSGREYCRQRRHAPSCRPAPSTRAHRRGRRASGADRNVRVMQPGSSVQAARTLARPAISRAVLR